MGSGCSKSSVGGDELAEPGTVVVEKSAAKVTVADSSGDGGMSNAEKALLDQLRAVDLACLMKLFNSKCTTQIKAKVLTGDGLASLYRSSWRASGVTVDESQFHLLQAFDRRRRGWLDLRDFSFGVAVCVHGGREERLRFLFDLFSKPAPAKSLMPDATVPPLQLSREGYGRLLLFCGVEVVSLTGAGAATDATAELDLLSEGSGGGTVSFPLSWAAFTGRAARHLDEQALDAGCAKLELLPGRREERRAIMDSVQGQGQGQGAVGVSVVGRRKRAKAAPVSEPTATTDSTFATSAAAAAPLAAVAASDTNSNSNSSLAAAQDGVPAAGGGPPKDSTAAVVGDASTATAAATATATAAATATGPSPAFSYRYAAGDTVFVLEARWWTHWCEYVSVRPTYDSSGLAVLELHEQQGAPPKDSEGPQGGALGSPIHKRLLLKSSLSTSLAVGDSIKDKDKGKGGAEEAAAARGRPHGIDNSSLLADPANAALDSGGAASLQPGLLQTNDSQARRVSPAVRKSRGESLAVGGGEEHLLLAPLLPPEHACVVLPQSTWDGLLRLYGGAGPAIPRKVASVTIHRGGAGTGAFTGRDDCDASVTVAVELYPTVLFTCWCSVLGVPDAEEAVTPMPVYLPSGARTVNDLVSCMFWEHFGVTLADDEAAQGAETLGSIAEGEAAPPPPSASATASSLRLRDVNVWLLCFSDDDDDEGGGALGRGSLYALLNGGTSEAAGQAHRGTAQGAEADGVRRQLFDTADEAAAHTDPGECNGTAVAPTRAAAPMPEWDYYDLVQQADGRIRHALNAVWLRIPDAWRGGGGRSAGGPTLASLGVVSGARVMFESPFLSPLSVHSVSRLPWLPSMRAADGADPAPSSTSNSGGGRRDVVTATAAAPVTDPPSEQSVDTAPVLDEVSSAPTGSYNSVLSVSQARLVESTPDRLKSNGVSTSSGRAKRLVAALNSSGGRAAAALVAGSEDAERVEWPTDRLLSRHHPRPSSLADVVLLAGRGGVVDAQNNRGQWVRGLVLERSRVSINSATGAVLIVPLQEGGEGGEVPAAGDGFDVHVAHRAGAGSGHGSDAKASGPAATAAPVGVLSQGSLGEDGERLFYRVRVRLEDAASNARATCGDYASYCDTSNIRWTSEEGEFDADSHKLAPMGTHTLPPAAFPPLRVTYALVKEGVGELAVPLDSGDSTKGDGDLAASERDRASLQRSTQANPAVLVGRMVVGRVLSALYGSDEQRKKSGKDSGSVLPEPAVAPHAKAVEPPKEAQSNADSTAPDAPSLVSTRSAEVYKVSDGTTDAEATATDTGTIPASPSTPENSTFTKLQAAGRGTLTPGALDMLVRASSCLAQPEADRAAAAAGPAEKGAGAGAGAGESTAPKQKGGWVSTLFRREPTTAGSPNTATQVVRGGRRRSSKPSSSASLPASSKPLGMCGLDNLGNTCFMAAGLQCLAHTPLLTAHFLSGRYRRDVNATNVLGTGGKLTEAYVALLHSMYNSGYTHVSPSRFKKVLGRFKSQFLGCDQQDSQEFLAEVLDCFHEDLNRVQVKPYIEAPPDEVVERMTDAEHAAESWGRHVARNSSVFVDVFQGQLKTVVRCSDCGKTSRTFDPFMFLSVPLPQRSDSRVFVTLAHRMQRHGKSVKFTPVRAALVKADSEGGADGRHAQRIVLSPTPAPAPSGLSCVLVSSQAHFSRYCVEVPKAATVADVKAAVSRLASVAADCLIAMEVAQSKLVRVVDDTDSVMTLGEGAGLVNAAETFYNYYGDSEGGLEDDAVYVHRGWGGGVGVSQLLMQESLKDLTFVTNMDPARLNNRRAKAKLPAKGKPTAATAAETPHNADYPDSSEYAAGYCDAEGDVIVDIDMHSPISQDDLPVRLGAGAGPGEEGEEAVPVFCPERLQLGQRVDAMDHREQWFPGNVVEFRYSPPTPTTANSVAGTSGSSRSRTSSSEASPGGVFARIHFDSFSHKWDEWYLVAPLRAPVTKGSKRGSRAIAPVYTRTQRKLRVLEMVVVQRQFNTSGAGGGSGEDASVPPLEFTNTPLILHCESFRSCEHAYQLILEQAVKHMTTDDWNNFFAAVAAVADPGVVEKVAARPDLAWERLVLASDYSRFLPFRIRILSQQHPLHVPPDAASALAAYWGAAESGALAAGSAHDGRPPTCPATSVPHMQSLLSAYTMEQLTSGGVATSNMCVAGEQGHVAWEGQPFPRDRNRPLCNIYHQRLLLSVDWQPIVPFYCSPAMCPVGSDAEAADPTVGGVHWAARPEDAKATVLVEHGAFSHVNRVLIARHNEEGYEDEVKPPLRCYYCPLRVYNAAYRFLVPIVLEHHSYIAGIHALRDVRREAVGAGLSPGMDNTPLLARYGQQTSALQRSGNNAVLLQLLRAVEESGLAANFYLPAAATAEAVGGARPPSCAEQLMLAAGPSTALQATPHRSTPLRLHSRRSTPSATTSALRSPHRETPGATGGRTVPSSGSTRYLMPQHQRAGYAVSTPGLSLYSCLDAFTREEVLDGESWYCGRCKTHRRGVMQQSIYRLPDVLVVHLKRFQMTARWREKITARVQFPVTGLDLGDYCGEDDAGVGAADAVEAREAPAVGGSGLSAPAFGPKPLGALLADVLNASRRDDPSGAQTGKRRRKRTNVSSDASPNRNLYDLYAVCNHIGSMSGGHYTAYVKCCCSAPGVKAAEDAVAGAESESDALASLINELDAAADGAPEVSSADNKQTVSALLNELFASSSSGVGGGAGGAAAKWLYFDDDCVREVPTTATSSSSAASGSPGTPGSAASASSSSTAGASSAVADRVVSEKAYVLFYRRRTLTTSNVLDTLSS